MEAALGRRKDNRGGSAAEEGEKAGEGGDTAGDAGTSGEVHRRRRLAWERTARPGPFSRLFSSPPDYKVEEDFGFEADEALDSSWVSRGPDKLLPYPTLASPAFD